MGTDVAYDGCGSHVLFHIVFDCPEKDTIQIKVYLVDLVMYSSNR